MTRGVRAALGLALRRARSAPGRWLPSAVPVALAVALLAGLSASGVVAGDHAARRALAGPAAHAPVVLTWSGGVGPRTDAQARRTLAAMGGGRVDRALLLTPVDFGRALVRFAAIDGAAGMRALTGRLPRGRCTAARCEVLHAGGDAPPGRRADGLGIHLVVVGRGLVTDAAPLGFATRPADFAVRGAERQPALLVAADPVGLDGLAALDSVSRVQNWSASLPVERLHAWRIGEQVRRIATERERLERRAAGFTVTSPQAALQAAGARAATAPGRLTAAGATAAAALAAFLLLAAGTLRRGLLAEDARLRRSGATTPQRAALALAETAVPLVAGLLAGAVLALAVAAVRARAGHVDTGHVLREAAGAAAARTALVGLAGWALILGAARVPAAAGRLLAAICLVASAALLAGVLAPRNGGGGDPLPAAVVPLAAVAAGLLVALALPALLRRVARAASGRPGPGRMALLELAREPGAATLAAAGLVVSVGLAGFGFAYRATLERSRADQADHRVPLAATVVPGADLRSPLAVRPAPGWARLPGVGGAFGVVRRQAALIVGPTRDPVSLVALPAAEMGRLAAWRPGDAAGDRGALSRRLVVPPFDRAPAGATLPAAADRIALPARAEGDRVNVALVVRGSGGGLAHVALGIAGGRSRLLRATLPRRVRGGMAVALELSPDVGQRVTATHHIAEGGGGSLTSGVLHLGVLRAGGTAVDLGSWRPRRPLRGPPDAVVYHLDGPALVRPDQPSDHAALPVLADAATARDARLAGEADLDVLGEPVRVRVVGVAHRFPTVRGGDRIVLADGPALSAALDASRPGSGEPRELWVAARPGEEAAAGMAVRSAARSAGLVARTHAAVRERLDTEPIAREVLGALAAAALLAALLAIAGVGIAVRRALRDDAAAMADLEAQGVGPAALRGGLRVRAAAIAVAGVVPGALLAVGLTRLVAGAVRAGADGAPDPPLVAVLPWATGAAAVAVLLVAAVAAGAAAAAPALREPFPAPSAEGGGA